MPKKGHTKLEPAKIGFFPKKHMLFGEKIILFFLLTILSTRNEVEKSTGYQFVRKKCRGAKSCASTKRVTSPFTNQ